MNTIQKRKSTKADRKLYDAAVKQAPDDMELNLALAGALADKGEYKSAAELYGKAASLAGNETDRLSARELQIGALRAKIFKGKYASGIEGIRERYTDLKQLFDLDENMRKDAQVLKAMDDLLSRVTSKIQKADAGLSRDIVIERATCYFAEGKAGKVVNLKGAYSKLLLNEPRLLLILRDVALSEGDKDVALKLHERISSLDSSLPGISSPDMAAIYLDLSRTKITPEEQIRYLMKASALDAGNVTISLELAEKLLIAGRIAEVNSIIAGLHSLNDGSELTAEEQAKFHNIEQTFRNKARSIEKQNLSISEAIALLREITSLEKRMDAVEKRINVPGITKAQRDKEMATLDDIIKTLGEKLEFPEDIVKLDSIMRRKARAAHPDRSSFEYKKVYIGQLVDVIVLNVKNKNQGVKKDRLYAAVIEAAEESLRRGDFETASKLVDKIDKLKPQNGTLELRKKLIRAGILSAMANAEKDKSTKEAMSKSAETSFKELLKPGIIKDEQLKYSTRIALIRLYLARGDPLSINALKSLDITSLQKNIPEKLENIKDLLPQIVDTYIKNALIEKDAVKKEAGLRKAYSVTAFILTRINAENPENVDVILAMFRSLESSMRRGEGAEESNDRSDSCRKDRRDRKAGERSKGYIRSKSSIYIDDTG